MTAEVTRRMLLGWVMNLGLARLFQAKTNGKAKVTITLHLDAELVKELQIAAESRNNISIEEYITETISCAVSDRSCEPPPKAEAEDNCYLCGHSMENNAHGMLASDYQETFAGRWVHSGHCSECKICNA